MVLHCEKKEKNRDWCWGTLSLWLASFYLLSHCAMISFAKAETLHIKLYSEHRLHPPCVLWKNPIIRLKVRETLQRSNQCYALYCARVQCIPKSNSSAAIFRNQIMNYYHSGSLVHSLMHKLTKISSDICAEVSIDDAWNICRVATSEVHGWIDAIYIFMHFHLFWNTLTHRILVKNTVLYFLTLICSLREGSTQFLLNILPFFSCDKKMPIYGAHKITFIQ